MVKRALSAVAGFLGLCLPLSAQQTGGPDVLRALNYSFLRLPSLALSDERFFSFPTAFSYIEMTPSPDFLPALPTMEKQRRARASATFGNDRSKDTATERRGYNNEVVDVQPPSSDYAGGEAGALYGHSSGKFGRDVEAGYIIGEGGDDKFQISAGAA